MKRLTLLLILLLPAFAGTGQVWTARSYTMADGLPGNELYRLALDRRGFLWIGTGNGLARFDGTTFRAYDVGDGLPDNEITQLCIDRESDRVWALPSRKFPAGHQPLTDRFSNEDSDPEIRSLPMGMVNRLQSLATGGVAICASNGKVMILRNGRRQVLQLPRTAPPAWCAAALGNDDYLLASSDSLRIFRHGRFLRAYAAPQPFSRRTIYVNGVLYSSDSASIYKTVLAPDGSVRRSGARPAPFAARHLTFSGRHLALISENGYRAVIVDTGTLQVAAELPLNNTPARDVLEDPAGNIWIATDGRGLLRLSHPTAVSYGHLLPPDMAPGTVAVDGPTLLCGDNRGRIVIFKRGCVEQIIDISRWSKVVSRIRRILVLRDGYYIAVEGDASLLLDKQYNIVSIYHRPLLNFSDQCAALWRDSIILAGSLERAVRLDYKGCHGYDSVSLRTTAIGADRQGRLLIGSTDGLYRKDDTGLCYFGDRYPLLSRRVTAICPAGDGLVWIGLASSHIVLLQGDSLAGVLPIGGAIPGNSCYALCAGKEGTVWVGTNRSLSRVTYVPDGGSLRWHAASFGASDGISGQVNAIAFQQDTVYAATTDGLFGLPAVAQPAVRNIPVYITGIRINDRDTFLADSWQLPYDRNDLELRFSGVDLSGYSPGYQYRINGGSWQDAGGPFLSLKRLSPGDYRIAVRAIKRDGTPSPYTAQVSFHLLTPFWLSVWFWLTVFCFLLVAAVALLHHLLRRKREKGLRQLAAEHELVTSRQQTFTALMNPHFIFNALNSIQHYVLVQDKLSANRYLSGFGRLIRMNFESAQKSYICLEEELERLQLYLSLEKMRFGDGLTYSIEVDEAVVPEDWQIPAMIIQPFLENALLHGIAPARQSGRLDIRIHQEGGRLHIRISDNGIGIANSLRAKGSNNGHVSKGMELIRKRIAVLKQLERQSIEVQVAPGAPADEHHPGTEVLLIFPNHIGE